MVKLIDLYGFVLQKLLLSVPTATENSQIWPFVWIVSINFIRMSVEMIIYVGKVPTSISDKGPQNHPAKQPVQLVLKL